MKELEKWLIAVGLILLAAFGIVFVLGMKKHAYEARIVELQNQVAERDQTIEVKEGVYQKLALQTKDLNSLLGEKDAELKALKDQLDSQGAKLLSATKLVVQLREDLKYKEEHPNVVHPPTDNSPMWEETAVNSNDQWDPFRITGKVVFYPQSHASLVELELKQYKPLSISVVLSQDSDGTWRTSSTSSAKNFVVDIQLAAVNPYMLEPRWFEKISLMADVGIGTNPGFMAGVGAAYEIGRFEVGPKVWAVFDRGASLYAGATLIWHPFKK